MARKKRFEIVRYERIAARPCPCGSTRRAFTDDPDRTASMHVVAIKKDSAVHYHRRITELYYILEGTGEMELDGGRYPVGPGAGIMIKPGCRHRAVGRLTVLVTAVPAFDPADETTVETTEERRPGRTRAGEPATGKTGGKAQRRGTT